MLFDSLTALSDPEPHGAALNMAIDEVLLRNARGPVLRIYRWARPAVSFGYFGKWAEVAREWPEREIVRRWTGGGIVPHGGDVTYTLIVPRGHPFFALGPLESYRAIHDAVARALGAASLAAAAAPKISDACFANAAKHDVMMAGRKVAGAAQRRTRCGLLHQGSIQPVEDAARVAAALPGAFAAHMTEMAMSADAVEEAAQLASAKYATHEWLHRY